MKHLKLFENFILSEYSDESKKLKQVFKIKKVSDFVSEFRKIASDPKVQAILKAGSTDGNIEDERIKYTEKTIKVSGLKPTQSEIGFNQSISNILTDQYGSLKSILDGKADVGGPIVTYNSKYIIDGHHRWSQIYAANPEAEVESLNIEGDLKPTEILKIVHGAIVAVVGYVPSADPKGINILDGITKNQVLNAVNKELSPEAKKLWELNGQKNNESIADLIYKNLIKLISLNQPIKGAPGRKDMPQTDTGGKPGGKLDLLSKGIINFKDPKASDVR